MKVLSRYIINFAAALLCIVAFCACSGNDKSQADAIVGKWVYTHCKQWAIENGVLLYSDETSFEDFIMHEYYEFMDDGTYVLIAYDIYYGEDYVYRGKWTLKDGKLILSNDDEDFDGEYDCSISNNKMTILVIMKKTDRNYSYAHYWQFGYTRIQ